MTLIQNALAGVETGLDADMIAVAGGGGTQTKRISIEGGAFRKIVGGKEVGVIEDRHMNVVIVKMAHTPNRQYYASAYTKGEKVSPKCWSSNSKTPDPDVEQPQSTSCDTCPQSVKGTGAAGKGTACRLQWRVAVVLPNHPEGDVLQVMLPAASCFGEEQAGKWPFRPYVQMLANHNISVGRVVTKMQFDINSSAPKLLFSAVAAVDKNDIPTITEQSKSRAAENAVKMVMFKPAPESAPRIAAPAKVEEVAAPPEFVAPEAEAEPRVRPSAKSEETPKPDVSDLVQRWAQKK
jgi:hypothetical protein